MLNIGDKPNNIYEIRERISTDGKGILFRAFDTVSNKEVVLKLLGDRGAIHDLSGAERLKALNSEYLPQVLDIADFGGELYLVMENVSGSSFSQLVGSGRVFAEGRVIKYAVRICEAINCLHSAQPPMLHGNITPSNIMLTDTDSICITGLGIGEVSGDISSDVYGIGESLYYIMTGRIPNGGKIDFRGINISNGFKHIIITAMEPDTEKRYKSAEEMLDALRSLTAKRTAITAASGTAAAVALILIIASVVKAQPKSVDTDNDIDTSSAVSLEDRFVNDMADYDFDEEDDGEAMQGGGNSMIGNGLRTEWIEKTGKVLYEQSYGEYSSFMSERGYVRLDDYNFDDVPEIILTSDGSSFRSSAVFDLEGNYLMDFITGNENYCVYSDRYTKKNVLMINGSAGSSADYTMCFTDRVELLELYDGGKTSGAEVYRTSYMRGPSETAESANDVEKLKKKYFGNYEKKENMTSSGASWVPSDVSFELSENYFAEAAEVLVDEYINFLITGVPNELESSFDNTPAVTRAPDTVTETESEKTTTTTVTEKDTSPTTPKSSGTTPTTTTTKPSGTTPTTTTPKPSAPAVDEDGYVTIGGKKYSTDLTELKLSDKGLTDDDIKGLSKMTKLTHLELDGNKISDISSIKNLTKLKYLSLKNNSISDISALKNLTNLTELYLDNNKISKISALNGLSKLKKLSIANNKVSDDTVVEYIRSYMPEDCDINY